MDFTFTEEQEAVRDLAGRIFEDRATVERVKEVEASDERVDSELWAELARANLLGLAVPEEHGGSGLGLVELCLVLEQQGRFVAPVPLLATLVTGALPIADLGTDEQRRRWLPGVVAGDLILTAALAEPGARDVTRPSTTATADGDGWRVDGTRVSVPFAHVADRVIVPAAVGDGAGLFLVDPAGPGVELARAEATDRSIQCRLTLAGAPAERVGGDTAVPWLLERALVGLCAVQVGVCEQAVRLAADYASH